MTPNTTMFPLSVLLAEPSTSTSLDLTQAKGLLNTTVKLPCEKPCHGVVKWVKVRSPPSQTIAHCENGTCADFGNKATVGLSGNIFLLLPQAALSDEGGYEGHCDGKVICDVTLELLGKSDLSTICIFSHVKYYASSNTLLAKHIFKWVNIYCAFTL